jgi:hypothetical protein
MQKQVQKRPDISFLHSSFCLHHFRHCPVFGTACPILIKIAGRVTEVRDISLENPAFRAFENVAR